MNRIALIAALACTLVGCAASGPREIKIVADENGFTPASVTAKKGGGIGLSNIRERLKALYGSSARLVLEENAPRGVVASIEVPATS